MICVPIKRKTLNGVLNSLIKAQKKADMIEVWFDELGKNLTEENTKKIFKKCHLPLIYKSTELKNLEKVLKFSPEYIDLDIGTSMSIIKKTKTISTGTKLIISFHDFKKTPDTKSLKEIASKISKKGADIIKIATHAKTFDDSLRIMSLLTELNSKGKKAICLCMGHEGKITRMTGHLLGNYLMYAPLKSSGKTAPGQVTLSELKKIHELTD